MDDERVIAVAYHEAGHIVAAAIHRFPLRPSGIHIHQNGWGAALFRRPWPRCPLVRNSPEEQRIRQAIVAVMAGLTAEREEFPTRPDASASDDWITIRQYVFGMGRWPDFDEARLLGDLKQHTLEVVRENWNTIREVAKQLLSVDWTSPGPEADHDCPVYAEERRLDGFQIERALRRCGIEAAVGLDEEYLDRPPLLVAD